MAFLCALFLSLPPYGEAADLYLVSGPSLIHIHTPGELDLLLDHEPEHDHSGDEDYSAQRQRHRERAGEMRDEAGHHGRERRAHIAAEILNAGDSSDDFF